MQMNHVKRERPLTHDLCKSLILGLGGALRRVQITEGRAADVLRRAAHRRPQGRGPDRRASVGLDRHRAPPPGADLRAEALLSLPPSEDDDEPEEDGQAGKFNSPPATPPAPAARERAETEALNAEQLKAYLENLRPEDFGKFNL
jgi:hypothetical protein